MNKKRFIDMSTQLRPLVQSVSKIVVVLGMHRSGTSAITRGLKVLGVILGDRLIPGIEDNNAKGFWEDIDITMLNNEMLIALKREWHHLTRIDSNDIETLRRKGFFLKATTLLSQKAIGCPIFGFKDPRLSKLLPFWEEVIEHSRFDVGYILAIRNPLSVAQSLYKRDGIDPIKSYLMWIENSLSILTGTMGKNRVLVEYDNLMQSPDFELCRMAQLFDLKLDPDELYEYKSVFLDKMLRHTVYELKDLFLDNACPALAQEIYSTFRVLASNKPTIDDLELQKQTYKWSAEFERMQPPLMLIDKLSKKYFCVLQNLGERDAQITLFDQAMVERDGLIANLNQALAERDVQILGQTQAAAEWDEQVDILRQAIAERDGQIASLNQKISGLHAQMFNLNEQLNSVSSELGKVFLSKSWMLTKPFRFIKKYLVTKISWFKRNSIDRFIDLVWRHVPLTMNQKRNKLNILLKTLPFLVSWYKKYQDRNQNRISGAITTNQTAISRVFDPTYYLSVNLDVMHSRIDPLQHFCTRGWREGRNPHPLFSTLYYLQRYPDVKEAGINPLEHYLCRGWLEGRDPHSVFDSAHYRKAGWYSTKCGASPLEYYLKYRCAATGEQLASFDSMLPRLQNNPTEFHFVCAQSTQLKITPLISIIMPTYNTPARYLEACIASVLAQTYGNWELCITDDGSVSPETQEVLERYSLFDSRIQVKWQEKNSGISAATNEALSRAQGEFVAMLDHDDTLEPDALLSFVQEINSHPDTDAIYSDQDMITADGERVSIYFKPNWSPELLRGVMYVGHLLMVRRSLAIDIGGFDSNFDRVQDFEFVLRVSEHTDRIRHIPKILYHWRMIPGSIAHNGDSKGKVEPLQCAAVNLHMARLKLEGKAVPHPVHAHRALIIPTKVASPYSMTVVIAQTAAHVNLNRCLDSLTGARMETEVLLFANDEAFQFRPGVRVMHLSSPTSPVDEKLVATKLLNRVLTEARGDYVLFMEYPMVLSPDWDERLALFCSRPNCGLVSPLVLNADGTVAEAGLLLHPRIGFEPAMKGWNPKGDGQAGSLSCAREVSAVSASCVCFRKSLVQQIGGFDSIYWCATFQVADASLKSMILGMSNLYVPTVIATHCEPTHRVNTSNENLDRELFMDRWSRFLNEGDRYHNPNFSPDNGGYHLL